MIVNYGYHFSFYACACTGAGGGKYFALLLHWYKSIRTIQGASNCEKTSIPTARSSDDIPQISTCSDPGHFQLNQSKLPTFKLYSIRMNMIENNCTMMMIDDWMIPQINALRD